MRGGGTRQSDLAGDQALPPVERARRALDGRPVSRSCATAPRLGAQGGEIAKTFKFKNYYETMAFVNATAWVSHREDHHPDLEVGYNRCRVRYSTHSVGGLVGERLHLRGKDRALLKM